MDFKKVILGTAQLIPGYGAVNPACVDKKKLEAILGHASDLGISTIDTAFNYGQAHKLLGSCQLKDFKIITKIPNPPSQCGDLYEWVLTSIECYISDLRIDVLEGLLLHDNSFSGTNFNRAIFDGLNRAKDDGLVKNIGASLYCCSEFPQRFTPDIAQLPLNPLDDSALRAAEKAPKCCINARSLFLQGVLLTDPKDLPPFFDPWIDDLYEWWNWCSEREISPFNACINFALQFPEINGVVMGFNSSDQLRDLEKIAYKDFTLPSDLFLSKEMNLIKPHKWTL